MSLGFSGDHQPNINVYWFTDVSLFMYTVDCFLLGINLLLLLDRLSFLQVTVCRLFTPSHYHNKIQQFSCHVVIRFDLMENMQVSKSHGCPKVLRCSNIRKMLGCSKVCSAQNGWCPQRADEMCRPFGPQALHRPSHTRHSHHAGSGVGCVMYTLEGTKRSSGPAGNFARNGRRTA